MTFSRAWSGYATDADARRARDLKYFELKADGRKPRRSRIDGQLRKYYGLADPCGITSTVYELEWEDSDV